MPGHSAAPKVDGLRLVRANHLLAAVGCALLLAVLVVATLLAAWRTYLAELSAEDLRTEKTSAAVAGLVGGLLERYVFVARSLAVNSRFSSPLDETKDIERIILTPLPYKQAGLVARYDHIQTWLQTEFGPTLPIPAEDRQYGGIPLWKITRGLPIRSPKANCSPSPGACLRINSSGRIPRY